MNPSTFQTNAFPTSLHRFENKGGKKFLVVPGVALVEGVLNGRLVPYDEFSFASDWNGVPVVVRHPKKNMGSARVPFPDVLEVGRFYNAKTDPKARNLKGEFWLDYEMMQNDDEAAAIAQRIVNKERVEVSTGYFSADEMKGGKFNDKPYVSVDRNIHPDHIALLVDQLGACSIADGCGLNRQNAKQNCGGCQHANEESFEKIASNIRDAFIRQASSPMPASDTAASAGGGYVRDIYEDYVIIDSFGKYYAVDYMDDGQGGYVFAPRSEWTQVEQDWVAATRQNSFPDHEGRPGQRGGSLPRGVGGGGDNWDEDSVRSEMYKWMQDNLISDEAEIDDAEEAMYVAADKFLPENANIPDRWAELLDEEFAKFTGEAYGSDMPYDENGEPIYSNANEFTGALAELYDYRDTFDSAEELPFDFNGSYRSFQDAGLLTRDTGLVYKDNRGNEFQLTVSPTQSAGSIDEDVVQEDLMSLFDGNLDGMTEGLRVSHMEPRSTYLTNNPGLEFRYKDGSRWFVEVVQSRRSANNDAHANSFPDHKGRPGQRGGSAPRGSGGASKAEEAVFERDNKSRAGKMFNQIAEIGKKSGWEVALFKKPTTVGRTYLVKGDLAIEVGENFTGELEVGIYKHDGKRLLKRMGYGLQYGRNKLSPQGVIDVANWTYDQRQAGKRPSVYDVIGKFTYLNSLALNEEKQNDAHTNSFPDHKGRPGQRGGSSPRGYLGWEDEAWGALPGGQQVIGDGKQRKKKDAGVESAAAQKDKEDTATMLHWLRTVDGLHEDFDRPNVDPRGWYKDADEAVFEMDIDATQFMDEGKNVNAMKLRRYQKGLKKLMAAARMKYGPGIDAVTNEARANNEENVTLYGRAAVFVQSLLNGTFKYHSNPGHAGRPGQVGGSAPRGAARPPAKQTVRKIAGTLGKAVGEKFGASEGQKGVLEAYVPTSQKSKIEEALKALGFQSYKDVYKKEGVLSFHNGNYRVHVSPLDGKDKFRISVSETFKAETVQNDMKDNSFPRHKGRPGRRGGSLPNGAPAVSPSRQTAIDAATAKRDADSLARLVRQERAIDLLGYYDKKPDVHDFLPDMGSYMADLENSLAFQREIVTGGNIHDMIMDFGTFPSKPEGVSNQAYHDAINEIVNRAVENYGYSMKRKQKTPIFRK